MKYINDRVRSIHFFTISWQLPYFYINIIDFDYNPSFFKFMINWEDHKISECEFHLFFIKIIEYDNTWTDESGRNINYNIFKKNKNGRTN